MPARQAAVRSGAGILTSTVIGELKVHSGLMDGESKTGLRARSARTAAFSKMSSANNQRAPYYERLAEFAESSGSLGSVGD